MDAQRSFWRHLSRWRRAWSRDLRRIEAYAGAALGAAAIALIWFGTWDLISSEKTQTERSAQRMLSNLAVVYEEDTRRALRAVDQTLLYLRESYLKDRERFDVSAWARRVQAITDSTFQTVIIGPDGLMKGSSIPSSGSVDLSDREHFRVHADRLVDDMFVSKPVVGRVSNRPSIQATRRIDNQDGSFAGVAVISVDPSFFTRFSGSIDLGRGGSIMLVGTDGVIRARKTAGGFDSGTSLAGTVLFETWKQNSGAGTYVVARSRTDGVARMVAYRAVQGLPLIVTVASGLDDIFAVYYQNRNLYLAAAGLLSLALLAATLLIVRYQRGLARAKDAAEAGTRARSAFLATMSHEIRTPMNAVLGLAGALLETPLSKDQRKSVAAINDAGGHLLRILNDILDFSKMEAGRLQLERIAFSPDTVVANVLSVIGPRARAKGLALEVDCAADLPLAVVGDPGRVGQVLMNVVSNAVKFTERGTVSVKVARVGCAGDRATTKWSVTDTGPGIPDDRLDKLFGEFVQADSSIARRYGGSGLGLAICKRIVDMMGGEIGVSSQEGRGSEFWFELTLPLAASLEVAKEAPDRGRGDALQAATKALGRPARVLLAEDNATNQMVVAKMLEGLDVVLTVVADGAEAVEAVSRFPFDLVFMDMCMPNMDGLQATAAIRARGAHYAKLPIVALTANIFPEDVRACRDAGMTGFIAKPVRKRELVEALAAALSGDLRPAAAETGPSPDSATSPDIDLQKLHALADEIGPEGVIETLTAYIEETQLRLGRLEALFRQQERSKLRVEAHTLKGASAAFGLVRFSAAARELELSAADIAADRFVEVAARLNAAFAEGRGRLREQAADLMRR